MSSEVLGRHLRSAAFLDRPITPRASQGFFHDLDAGADPLPGCAIIDDHDM